ncbi:MAG: ATP-binding protein [Candidatus Delongbacteria bacterium]|nr:ATP-binding protein [Candidatus Delongbacteria bacterium]MCG2760092.1 ATP-binding protein [Candidatus Delongbacteria bacterium]
MEDLSLHILDVVENSIEAGASKIEIKIIEDKSRDLLEIEIKDNGRGMSEETLSKVLDPFYTTRTTRRVGMGLSLLVQAAKDSNGNFEINSSVGVGTEVKASFQYSHIDRKPIGDLKSTFIILITSYPEINFIYIHQDEEGIDTLDSNKI